MFVPVHQSDRTHCWLPKVSRQQWCTWLIENADVQQLGQLNAKIVKNVFAPVAHLQEPQEGTALDLGEAQKEHQQWIQTFEESIGVCAAHWSEKYAHEHEVKSAFDADDALPWLIHSAWLDQLSKQAQRSEPWCLGLSPHGLEGSYRALKDSDVLLEHLRTSSPLWWAQLVEEKKTIGVNASALKDCFELALSYLDWHAKRGQPIMVDLSMHPEVVCNVGNLLLKNLIKPLSPRWCKVEQTNAWMQLNEGTVSYVVRCEDGKGNLGYFCDANASVTYRWENAKRFSDKNKAVQCALDCKGDVMKVQEQLVPCDPMEQVSSAVHKEFSAFERLVLSQNVSKMQSQPSGKALRL